MSPLLLALLVAGAPAPDDRPNIVFLLTDDHRADLLGCAGHPILKTPNIDRLAARGVRFENMFVTTSICAASRATLFTGLYESGHGYTFGTPPIAAPYAESSYPALLREAGYRTGFVGKFGVNVTEGMTDRMFDTFVDLFRNPYFKPRPDGTVRHLTDITADRAIEFIEGGDGESPFCLSVSFNAPHAEDSDKEDPYPWPPSADGLYEGVVFPPPPRSEPSVFESQPEFLRDSMNRDRWYWRWDTPEKYQKNVRAYFRLLSGVDHAIGRVLEAIERRGLTNSTVIIFSGDNGYYLGSRGFAGKWSHYEESLRVPLIVADPRADESNRGTVVEPLVLNVDIPPMILGLAGVDVPSHYQGRDLAPLLHGEVPDDWRTDFFCEHRFNHPRIPKWEGVRDRRWVYARYYEQVPPFEFLHDLDADPQELRNIADDPGSVETLGRLRERCDGLRSRLTDPLDAVEDPGR